MAIDAKSILVCLWKIVRFSMKICYKFVSEHPVFSSVSFFFILLYMFSPTFLAFVIYSLLILISAYGIYRVFYNGDNTSSDIAKSYKKNDGDPSNMGTNGNISDEVRIRNREKFTRRSNIEDKNAVCSTTSRDDKVDKSVNVEENVKDIKDVKVDSATDGAECSPRKAGEVSIFQINDGCDEGPKICSRRKKSSETSEDSQEDRDEDERKHFTDPEESDMERSKRLETMIARRKARKCFSFQVRHSLMKGGNNDPVEHLASILVPRRSHLISNNLNGPVSPGSAPSVLLPMHNPFDIPYDTHEERPNLTDESFRKEFLAENRDLVLCRHASFSWRALFSLDAIGDQDKTATNDILFKPRAPQKLKNAILALGNLENKDVKKVLEKESCQENEAISSGCSAEDHATQEGQAAQREPDSVHINHKEDKGDTQKKEIVAENIGVRSSSSSSSEENLPVCKPDKDEILKSLLAFRRNIVLPKDDDYQMNGFTHNSDQTILNLNNIKSDDGFLYAARVMSDHPRSNSLASDMLVEVSEISSPRSISSLEEVYSGNEELKEVSSHPSQVDPSYASNSREVPDISDQQDISGVSINNHDAEALTSDVLAEKVFEENSINSNTANKMDNETPRQILSPMDLPESSNGSNSNSVNHQDLSESSLQNQQNENKEHFKDYNVESQYQPSQANLADNPTSVQSDPSLRSPENQRDDEVVSEFEFPVSSAENEASGVVSEIETQQLPIISSSGSSPKSVLQPKFSSHVSLMDLNQGTTTEYQQSHNEIVDDDSVLPVVDLNHSAFQNISPRQEDWTSQPSHVIDRLQSPRFVDALFCLPFRSTVEELQNGDASISTSGSSFYQDIHDPYPHQSNFNQEACTSNHIDNSDVNDNQARTNLESVENIEGDNHNESSMKQDAVFDQKQTELSNSTGNLVAHVDVTETLDPPLESTMEEGNNSSAIQNDSVINKSEDSELKSVKGDIGDASEHVIRSKDVHNPSELDATLDSKSTADVEGGLSNHSEVEITADDNK